MCGEVLFRLKTARCNKGKAWSPNTIGCEHFESRKGNSGQTGDYLWITWFTFKSRQMQIHFSKQIDSNVKSAFQKRKMLDHLCSQSRQILFDHLGLQRRFMNAPVLICAGEDQGTERETGWGIMICQNFATGMIRQCQNFGMMGETWERKVWL